LSSRVPFRSHSLVLTAAACLASLAWPRTASAAEHWLQAESSERCSASAAWLTAAIRSRVAGEPNAALQVKVTLSDAAQRGARGATPTRARIEVALGAESIGSKRLEA